MFVKEVPDHVEAEPDADCYLLDGPVPVGDPAVLHVFEVFELALLPESHRPAR